MITLVTSAYTAIPGTGNIVSRELVSREEGQEILERVERVE